METIKEILLWVGIVAILVPFICMCLITIKDTIDYLKDEEIDEEIKQKIKEAQGE